MRITTEQLRKLRHALGLDWRKKPYRNHYSTREECDSYPDCVELERLGLMERYTRESGWMTFSVTPAGIKVAKGGAMKAEGK